MSQHDRGESGYSEGLSPENASEPKREISTIAFPYGDLDDAVSFAKAIHQIGGQSCLAEQLAAYLDVAATGGAFRARMAHPRIFGLVEYDKSIFRLTSLGMRVIDPEQEASAKVEAFLNVPLYKAIYDRYKGYPLPPPSALEQEIANLGVSSKQKEKARQVFDRSAKQAGFFWAGTQRLTIPSVKHAADGRSIDEDTSTIKGAAQPVLDTGGSAETIPSHLDPLLIELLRKIPAAENGWPAKQRLRWFRTFTMNVSQIYDQDNSPVDLNVSLDESQS